MSITTIADLLEACQEDFIPEKADGLTGIIQLILSGEGGGSYYLAVQNSVLVIDEGRHSHPDVTLRASARDWIELSLGDVNPTGLLLTGRLKIEGSIPFATRFQSLFRTD